MPATYLTTDIIVIIVLAVVLVFVGIGAFLIHFYWTKIGVAEIWNTEKWSSMRSSFYRTIQRFSRGSNRKFASERPLSDVSIYSDDIEDLAFEGKKADPKITSYITPPSRPAQKPVSMISYDDSVRRNDRRKIRQPIDGTSIPHHYESSSNNRHYDLASMVQKQRF